MGTPLSPERTLTHLDYVRLTRLASLSKPAVNEAVETLLENSELVPSRSVAPTIVTMYTQLLFKDLASDDAPDKVLALYRGKLDRFGTVVECKGLGTDVQIKNGRGMNTPVTCSKEGTHKDETSLKVGTEGNQHQVSVRPSGKGS